MTYSYVSAASLSFSTLSQLNKSYVSFDESSTSPLTKSPEKFLAFFPTD